MKSSIGPFLSARSVDFQPAWPSRGATTGLVRYSISVLDLQGGVCRTANRLSSIRRLLPCLFTFRERVYKTGKEPEKASHFVSLR